MLNEKFILQRMQPYLNEKNELSEFEFFKLFSGLNQQEQYEIVNLMIVHNIELVEEKEKEAELLNNGAIIGGSAEDIGYEQMMNLTNEQLCVLAQQGDHRASAAILKKNERFIYKIALELQNQFSKTNLTVDDLFQEGNIGMIEAIKRFNPELEYKFLTYSWYWIKQKIIRAAIDKGYLIRLPVHMFDKVIKINTYCRKHPEESLGDLVEIIRKDEPEVTKENVQFYIRLGEIYLDTTSLNVIAYKGGDTELQDLLPDNNAVSIEDEIASAELRQVCEKVLGMLKPREEQIMRLRFGFDDGRPHTLEEIGEIYGVTRERIRQIEAKALEKLRHPTRAKYLQEFIVEENGYD